MSAAAQYRLDKAEWQKMVDQIQSPQNTEAIINKGTEEINSSLADAQRSAGASAAAAGITNPADLQGGLQALGSQYAGMRANLARDARSDAENRRQENLKWAWSARPQAPVAGGLAGLGAGAGGRRAGGGGGSMMMKTSGGLSGNPFDRWAEGGGWVKAPAGGWSPDDPKRRTFGL